MTLTKYVLNGGRFEVIANDKGKIINYGNKK